MVDKYLVLGNPIAQSKSPFIHNHFATQTSQKMSYDKHLVAIGDFETFITTFQAEGGRGCNVTAPFKESAFKLSQHLSPRAKAAGAVNTLTFNDDGLIYGDNTDGQGLVEDLLSHNVILTGQRLLIIGAGGAARGSILPLLAQNPASITIANRTLHKAQLLISEFNDERLSCCDLQSLSIRFDIIINSTSASLSNELPNIAEDVIAQATCCYDMAYSAEPTCFIAWANNLGVKHTIDGLGMLIGQAAESFRVWRGVKPETKTLLSLMREQL